MRNFKEFKKFAIANGWIYGLNHCFFFYNRELNQHYVINTTEMLFIEYNDSGSVLQDNLTASDLKTLAKVFGDTSASHRVTFDVYSGKVAE